MTHGDRIDDVDVVVVGAGQSGLAVGFFLARMRDDVARGRRDAAPGFLLLDDRGRPGGAWSDGWDSLRLFSPASASSLPGWGMPPWPGEGTPSADHVSAYLAAYEARYDLPVSRPERVLAVERAASGFLVTTGRRQLTCRVVVMVGGTGGRPVVPDHPGVDLFRGKQLHSADYRAPGDLAGRRVLVVGGGNSGAQIAAELAEVADTSWVTREPPRWLPDDVDGRALFRLATRQVAGGGGGVGSLGDVVVTPPVLAARTAGLLETRRPFVRMTRDGVVWPDGQEEHVDAVVWCTGYRPDLGPVDHLPLTREGGHPVTSPELATESRDLPGLFFVGYGDWCGVASATLVGVGASARATVRRIDESLDRSTSM